MLRSFLLALFTVFLTLFLYLFFYLGVYKSVAISSEKRGPLYLLYKDHTGAYHEIGPTIQEVEAYARTHSLDCPLTFGEYLDNPDAVDQDRLRSRGGCVLSAPLANPPADLHYEERPEHAYLIGHFDGSPAIGPFKVYPKMKKSLAEQKLKASPAVMETYRIEGSKVLTEYLFFLEDTPAAASH